MNIAYLQVLFSYIMALEHNFDLCWLKLRWLSISIPTKFKDLGFRIPLLYIFDLCVFWFSLLLFIIIAWNLSRLTIVLFFLNQSTADSGSCSRVWRRSFKLLHVITAILLSVKCFKSDFLSHKRKSYIKMSIRIGPSIEPCDVVHLKVPRYML